MRQLTVGDLMTRAVVRVHHHTRIKDVAAVLAEHSVRSVPVVDDSGHPLGVVTGKDLMRRRGRSGRQGAPPVRRLHSVEGAEAEARTAGELMTAPAVTAPTPWTVAEAARAMERHGVKRLPVVGEAGCLVGIVSRADLLGVFLRGNSAIAEEISQDILERTMGFAPAQVAVTVTEGRVVLRGSVEQSLIPVVERLCRGVDGVTGVRNDLTCPAVEPSAAVLR